MARTRDSLARENEELHDLVLLKESYNGTMRSSHRAVSITMTLLMFSGTDCPLNGSWDMHRGGGMRKVNPGKINSGYLKSGYQFPSYRYSFHEGGSPEYLEEDPVNSVYSIIQVLC